MRAAIIPKTSGKFVVNTSEMPFKTALTWAFEDVTLNINLLSSSYMPFNESINEHQTNQSCNDAKN